MEDAHLYYDESIRDQYYTENNIVRINPTQSATGESFSGNFSIEIDISKEMLALPQEAKIYVQYKGFLCKARAANEGGSLASITTAAAANGNNVRPYGCIAPGGIMNCFSKLHHEIYGAGVIQGIENVPQTNGLIRLANDQHETASKNGCDPWFIFESGKYLTSKLRGQAVDGTGTLFYADTYLEFSDNDKRKLTLLETIIKNANTQGLLSGSQNSKTITLSSYIPLSFFMSQKKAYQSKHILRFFIDPQWRQNMLLLTSALGASVGTSTVDRRLAVPYGDYDSVTNSPTFARTDTTFNDLPQGQISLVVSDVWLEIPMVKISQRPIGIRNLFMDTFNTTINNIPTNTTVNNFTISCAPHTHKIVIGFQRPIRDYCGDVANNVTFSRVTESRPISMFTPVNISDIRIRYLDNVYPNVSYDLKFNQDIVSDNYHDGFYRASEVVINPTTNGININTSPRDNYPSDYGDCIRAYNDYYTNMEFTSPSECMTFRQWLNNPIFVFKFVTTTNISSNLDVYVKFSQATSQEIRMYTLYYHKGLLTCDFQEDDVSYKFNYLI